MRSSPGRPQKYAVILWSLADDELFTPAKIAARARKLGLIGPAMNEVHGKLLWQRVRIALGRFSNNHGFPDNGDGLVTLFGQCPTVGWYGRRWKACAQPLDEGDFEKLKAALAHLPIAKRATFLAKVKRK